MKQIKAIASRLISINATKETNILEVWNTLQNSTKNNRSQVIEGASSVERQIEDIITCYFLGKSHQKRDIFESLILNSDWCSFAAKRKLVRYIIEEQKLLEGKEKQDFDTLLGKVMSYRNAFTHGQFSQEESKVWLSYFEGTPRKIELTDEYLIDVESSLLKAHELATNLSLKVGAIEWQGKFPIKFPMPSELGNNTPQWPDSSRP
jgi:hypothetical protein